jgi:hypothetical protein
VRRPEFTRSGITNAGLKLASGLAALAFFLVVVVGGGVYRTDCVTSSGQVVTDWGAQDLPYVWSPGDSHCRAHTLIRFALGTVGVMSPVSTADHAYNAQLIQRVGAGSIAEAQLIPALESLKAVGGFSDASTQQALVYLFQGQLDKLGEPDLVKLAQENRTAATHIGPVLTKLNHLAASISGSTVNASVLTGLPDDSRTFSAHWNRYLTYTAGALRAVKQALTGMNPVYGEIQRLLHAAYDTAQLHSTAQFDKVRSAVFKDIGPRYAAMQTAQQTGNAARPVEQTLVKFVNGNQDAQVIVTRVNHDYPNGFLAQEFKGS